MKYPLLACLLLLAFAFCAWAGRSVLSAADDVDVAREELEECLEIASEIDALDQRPQRISRAADLGDATRTTLQSLDLQSKSIRPIAASEFGTSGYKQEQAVVTAENWTLGQLTQFLQAMEEQHPSVRLNALSLDARSTKAGSTEEVWSCRITLTQFITSQITPDP